MKDLTSGNIYKNFILFAIPMVLSGMLSQAYATIDTVIAGKFIGDTALAAIGATSPLISFISSMFWGFGTGFSIYIARLFGAQDYKKIKSVLLSGLLTVACIIIGISALCIIFKDPIFSFLKIDSQTAEAAADYFICYMTGFVLIMGNSYGVFLMNAFGIGTFPFIMSVLSAVLNVSGNIFSVVVLDMGVLGLALSSVVAAGVVVICYFFKLRQIFKEMGVSGERASFDRNGLWASTHYALPNMLQQMTMYAAGMVISPMINNMGKDATAAYTVAHRVYEINASVYQNSSKTVSNYTSQACGAGKYHLLKKGAKVGVIQALLFALPFISACALFPETIAGLFFDGDASPKSIEYAVLFLSRFLPLIIINVFANFFHAFFRGLGEKSPLIISTFFGSLARILVSLLLISKMGMTGMYIGWVASWVADAVAGLLFYLFKKDIT